MALSKTLEGVNTNKRQCWKNKLKAENKIKERWSENFEELNDRRQHWKLATRNTIIITEELEI